MEQNSQPLVSVVIPCYNHEKFVQDCIQSIIDQTYENIELIIIDDGSKDDSVAKIEEMIEICKQRFNRFEFRSRLNLGLSATLNEAIEWCEGEYYSAIASDDMALEKKIQTQVDFLAANKKCIAVFGGIHLIDEKNNIIGTRINDAKEYTFKEIILNEHDLPASTQLARLDVIKKLNGYDEKIKIEDWYMLLKMTSKNDVYICYLNKLMCKYRFHDNNLSKDIKLMSSDMRKILEEYRGHELYQSALLKISRLEFSYYKFHKRYFKALVTLIKYIKLKFTRK